MLGAADGAQAERAADAIHHGIEGDFAHEEPQRGEAGGDDGETGFDHDPEEDGGDSHFIEMCVVSWVRIVLGEGGENGERTVGVHGDGEAAGADFEADDYLDDGGDDGSGEVLESIRPVCSVYKKGITHIEPVVRIPMTVNFRPTVIWRFQIW